MIPPLGRAGSGLIAVDRPGYRHSTYQPGRRLSDWADDIAQLGDHLSLDRTCCQNNTPPALYGDAYGEVPGNGPNSVGHKAIGECANLTVPPSSS